jgi:hypothetical protein
MQLLFWPWEAVPRKGEIFGLTWADVSFEEKAITISLNCCRPIMG